MTTPRPVLRRTHLRGLTLIELLAALTMLAALVSTTAAWLVAASRGTSDLRRRLLIDSAISAALERIGEDIVVGDFTAASTRPTSASPGAPARITIGGTNEVTIVTRGREGESAGRPVIHTYRLDPVSSELRREASVPHGRSLDRRILCGGLRSFEVEMDEPPRVLRLRIVTTDGQVTDQSWRIP